MKLTVIRLHIHLSAYIFIYSFHVFEDIQLRYFMIYMIFFIKLRQLLYYHIKILDETS